MCRCFPSCVPDNKDFGIYFNDNTKGIKKWRLYRRWLEQNSVGTGAEKDRLIVESEWNTGSDNEAE